MYDYEYPAEGKSPMGINREFGLPTRIETNPEKIKFFNTDLFANFNGEDLPVYENLNQIPKNLPDGQKLVLQGEGLQMIPNWNTQWHARIYYDEQVSANGSLLLWWQFLIIVVVVTIAASFVILMFRNLINAIREPPCGRTGRERVIDECHKVIVYPNCDGVLINTCTGDIEDTFHTSSTLEKVGLAVLLAGIGIAIFYLVTKRKEIKEKVIVPVYERLKK